MKRAPLAIVGGLILIAILIPLTGGSLGRATPSGAPSLRPSAGDAIALPSPTGAAAAPSAQPTHDSPTSPPSTTPVAPPAASQATPLVPVTHFRSTRTATNHDEVAAVLAGTSDRYDGLELVAADADGILASLGLADPGAADRLIRAPDAATLAGDLAKHRKRLAFLRADQVTPAVRALAWGKATLFGGTRVKTLADWPLMADLPAPAAGAGDGAAFDPAATWTLLAGGDIMLDRGVYETVEVKGKGVDFPFDGGTAEITGHCKDCSPLGWDTPYTKRTGNQGAVRRLISGADIAIANFENPAPNRWTWHTSKTVFSADPALIAGLKGAGFDFVGIANNHIGDARRAGVVQTVTNLRKYGLRSGGAGKDETAARKPVILDAAGTKVAVLPYDAIAPGYHAKGSLGGSAGLSVRNVRADVRKARAAGADVVIVFPHWGIEYRAKPTAGQRAIAHAIIDAGADMIIGNHAHWAAAMEVYKGRPIWYALGNLIFDQTWSEPTMEGMTLELTFAGRDLVQARMRPHLILDKAQPNLMDPAGDGKVVLDQVFRASKGLLPW